MDTGVSQEKAMLKRQLRNVALIWLGFGAGWVLYNIIGEASFTSWLRSSLFAFVPTFALFEWISEREIENSYQWEQIWPKDERC